FAGPDLAAHAAEATAGPGPGGQDPGRVGAGEAVGVLDHRLDLDGQDAALGHALDGTAAAAVALDQAEQDIDIVLDARLGGGADMGAHVELDPLGAGDGEGLGARLGSEDGLGQFDGDIGPALGQAVDAG